jgi:excisionase family DNA binding protein
LWTAPDKDLLDVEGAAALLGVSTRTIYTLASKGDIPATRVGRAWRFARRNLIAWVANGSQADQLATARRHGRVAKRQRELFTRVWPAQQAHDAQPPCGCVPQRIDIAIEVLRCTACHT